MKKLILLLAAVVRFSCGEEMETPQPGKWRAVLKVQDNKELPFLFEAELRIAFSSDFSIVAITGKKP